MIGKNTLLICGLILVIIISILIYKCMNKGEQYRHKSGDCGMCKSRYNQCMSTDTRGDSYCKQWESTVDLNSTKFANFKYLILA